MGTQEQGIKADSEMNQLTALQVERLSDPGQYPDGGGLTLRVHTSGDKTWVLPLTIDGKLRERRLGGYPQVGLTEARRTAEDMRQRLRRGDEPSAPPEIDYNPPPSTLLTRLIMSVLDSTRDASTVPVYESRWRDDIDRHVPHELADAWVHQITREYVLDQLQPVWKDDPTLASEMARLLEVAFDEAIAKDFRDDNPAREVMRALPSYGRAQPLPALHHGRVRKAVESIREAPKQGRTVKLALEFLIFTVAHTSEVRAASWEEIDLSAKVWSISAERTKVRIEQHVPLSAGALAIVEGVRQRTRGHGLLFPQNRKEGQLLAPSAMLKLLRSATPFPDDQVTIDGLRSAFRTWAHETNKSWALAEAVLSDKLGSREVQVYLRSDRLEQRRELMQAWCDYLRSVD